MSVAALQLQLLLAEPGDWPQLLGLGREGCYRRTCPFVFLSIYLYICFFPPNIFRSGARGVCRLALPICRYWGSGWTWGERPALGRGRWGRRGKQPSPPSPLPVSAGALIAPGSAGQRPEGPHPRRATALSILGTPETRTVCECLWVRVCAPRGVRAWGGAWREPAPAGHGLNVAFPTLTSAIKGDNPASLAHFLKLAGLFAGGKEKRASPRNASVGVFFLLFGYCSWWLHALALLWRGLRVAECP